jgi:phosphoenolpyruvate synthase/pyruvate phosphate dikinase
MKLKMIVDSVGTKAEGLRRLAEVVNVPPFITFAATLLATGHTPDRTIFRHLDEAKLREPYAVRSSSIEEDGATDAFAGMFKTILSVSRDDLPDAVREVWESSNTDRVAAYRAARGLANSTGGVSVIVQEIVQATAAGVAFSRHPTDANCVLLEAVRGLGELLVSGEASPDSLSIRRHDLTLVSRARGKQYLEIRPDGTRAMLRARDVSGPKIDERDAKRIAEKLIALESSFPEASNGLDVEWALADRELLFLQCRPITTTPLRSDTRSKCA